MRQSPGRLAELVTEGREAVMWTGNEGWQEHKDDQR